MRTLSFVSASVVLSATISLSAAAADSRLSAGVRVGADWIPSAKVVATADTPTAEVFARLSLSPSTALELAIGYRHFHYDEFGGRWTNEYSLTQVPIAFGLHYVLSPTSDVRPTFGAGIHCSVTRDSFSTYLYPNSYQTDERSKVVLGGYGQFGVQVMFGPTVFGDIMARYVFNPISSGTGEPSNQDYVRLQAGIGARF